MNRVFQGAVLLLFSFLLLASVLVEKEPKEYPKTYFLEQGTHETGAVNLVTALYLAYRAYDTLGETIVLIGAVTGVLVLVGRQK
jgi:multicomponent Na+:H+ antiporter subunit B